MAAEGQSDKMVPDMEMRWSKGVSLNFFMWKKIALIGIHWCLLDCLWRPKSVCEHCISSEETSQLKTRYVLDCYAWMSPLLLTPVLVHISRMISSDLGTQELFSCVLGCVCPLNFLFSSKQITDYWESQKHSRVCIYMFFFHFDLSTIICLYIYINIYVYINATYLIYRRIALIPNKLL